MWNLMWTPYDDVDVEDGNRILLVVTCGFLSTWNHGYRVKDLFIACDSF